MYAGRKRRKPAQKGVKPAPADSAKSNPSKRHRDRLNSELDRLASLLPFPEDVISSLDKLSILRLSVSFLRTKSFFSVALKKQLSNGVRKSSELGDDGGPAACVDGGDVGGVGVGGGGVVPEGELLLQALNGFVLVVTAEGIIFYCSHTIQDYLGFHQTDVMHQSVFELIHTEDQQEFRSNLHWALNPPAGHAPPADPSTDGEPVSTPSCLVSYNPEQLPPENSSFLERGFVCRFRCLLDNSSGFLALNIQGRLKFLHGQSRQRCEGDDGGGGAPPPPQLALFAIATPLQPPAILEIRTRNMIFRTKHKLDFTPMACDAKGKIVLGYTEAELRVRGSGYQFIHAADMLYCAENHVRMMKTGESGLTVFRLLTKDNRWKWVQANARLVYKNGKPDYIIATQRPLVDEEGGEHLRKRSMHLPFTFATGEAMLYHTGYPLHGFPDSSQAKAKGGKAKKGKVDRSSADGLDPKSLLGALMSQDESVYVCQPDTQPAVAYHSGLFGEPRADGVLAGLLGGGGDDETGRCAARTASYDPLLATLDSLTLDGEETCSNSELFSALENLGLNAEDLELLLLDERMMQVELDPNHIPTLGDLLTNNEILSYIQDSLENDQHVDRNGLGSSTGPPPNPDPDPASQPLQAGLPPIVQLSQQMQQHVGAGEPLKAQPGTTACNGHWAEHRQTHHRHRPHPGLKASQVNGEQKHLKSLLESGRPWDQHPVPLQTPQQVPLPGFQHHAGLNGAHLPNGHAAFPPSAPVGLPGYGVAASDGGDLYHGPPPPPPSYRLQAPPQGSALELEHLLGLSQPQHGPPSPEAYGVFSSSQDAKLENGCLLSATNAAYIRTCLMPNGNGLAPPPLAPADVPVPITRPDGLSALQDPQKSGFFL